MSQNFLEHYAQMWARPVSWAERRLRFLDALNDLLSQPGMEEAFREWALDREKMHQVQARQAAIGSGDFCYWQGVSNEAGMLVDNWRAELMARQRSQEQFDQMQAMEEAEQ